MVDRNRVVRGNCREARNVTLNFANKIKSGAHIVSISVSQDLVSLLGHCVRVFAASDRAREKIKRVVLARDDVRVGSEGELGARMATPETRRDVALGQSAS